MASPPIDFSEAYGRFLPPIRAKCRRILGRTALADEVAQETFTRLWQSGPRLDGKTETRTIMAWLYVTSTRLATDLLRQGKVVPLDESAALSLACSTSPADAIAARSSIVALAKSVPADALEAALLTRVDGLTHPEVADLLGVSERTIRRRLEVFDGESSHLRSEVAR